MGDLFDRSEEKMENMMLELDFSEKNRREEAVLRRQIRCIDIMALALARSVV